MCAGGGDRKQMCFFVSRPRVFNKPQRKTKKSESCYVENKT